LASLLLSAKVQPLAVPQAAATTESGAADLSPSPAKVSASLSFAATAKGASSTPRRAVAAVVSNAKITADKPVIAVLSHKNHALDEFLMRVAGGQEADELAGKVRRSR